MREIRQALLNLLKSTYETRVVSNCSELAKTWRDEWQPDVLLMDMQLPDGNGVEQIRKAKTHWPRCEIIVMTGYGSIETAVKAIRSGAYDFITKPFEQEKLLLSITRALEHQALVSEAGQLRQVCDTIAGKPAGIFRSPTMVQLTKTIRQIAKSDVAILLVGESGTGKEVLSDLIHQLSGRTGKHVKINCAALPRELIESELFGSAKGAFTGAQGDRSGLFVEAQDGTIMLDEISEMYPDTQTKLLRVLQDKEVRPVGAKVTRPVNCRVISATNRPLQEALQQHKIREDLFYRISTITLEIPPLRERKEDILPLATAFLHRFAAQAGRNILGFTPEAIATLEAHQWPGNVRQLQNEIQRAVLLTNSDWLTPTDLWLPPYNKRKEPLTQLEALEYNTIQRVLQAAGGKKQEALRRLGISRQALDAKIKHYEALLGKDMQNEEKSAQQN